MTKTLEKRSNITKEIKKSNFYVSTFFISYSDIFCGGSGVEVHFVLSIMQGAVPPSNGASVGACWCKAVHAGANGCKEYVSQQ
jgi:hypothetical protein